MLPNTLYIMSPSYVPANFEVATYNSLGDIFTRKYALYDLDLGVKATQNVAQNPLNHITYVPAKFEVATSNRLGKYAFTRKYYYLTQGQGHTKHLPVPSTSCDLYICKV